MLAVQRNKKEFERKKFSNMVIYEKNEQTKATNKLLELKVNLAISLYTKSV